MPEARTHTFKGLHAFLINCSAYHDRLSEMKIVFNQLNLSYDIISCWDADMIQIADVDEPYWQQRVCSIKAILLANAYHKDASEYNETLNRFGTTDIQNIPWLQPRRLSLGELSVLLKHFTALVKIAFGHGMYGIIFEDDVRLKPDSKKMFERSLDEFIARKGNYLDLAGGAGLATGKAEEGIGGLKLMMPARTRTSACYCVSKQLAKNIICDFFPLAIPIDWQIQYTLTRHEVRGCYWPEEPPLLHGSEVGLVKSWRS